MMTPYSFPTPIGVMEAWEEEGKLTRLSLRSKTSDAPDTQAHMPPSPLFARVSRQIHEYFCGDRTSFTLPLCYTHMGTPFQQRVWSALLHIPYGETRCYEDIAICVGNPGAVRAVGQAIGKNPLMLVVPCHRVIHKNGDSSGFHWGSDIKKRLLALEQHNQ